MKMAVSACLLGVPCRYDGRSKKSEKVCALGDENELIPVCPEQLGGLPVPRVPCELIGGRVTDKNGNDVTEAFVSGTDKALRIAIECGAEAAVLKEYSPSCGTNFVYDGTFSGKKIPGRGIFASKLVENGIRIISDEQL